jgi:hypothetical protein
LRVDFGGDSRKNGEQHDPRHRTEIDSPVQPAAGSPHPYQSPPISIALRHVVPVDYFSGGTIP